MIAVVVARLTGGLQSQLWLAAREHEARLRLRLQSTHRSTRPSTEPCNQGRAGTSVRGAGASSNRALLDKNGENSRSTSSQRVAVERKGVACLHFFHRVVNAASVGLEERGKSFF